MQLHKISIEQIEAAICNTLGFFFRDWRESTHGTLKRERGEKALEVTFSMEYLITEIRKFAETPDEIKLLDNLKEEVANRWSTIYDELYPHNR